MAKKKAKLPSVGDTVQGCESTALVEIPLGVLNGGYVSNRCDIVSLSVVQRNALRRIMNGLIEEGATLANGKNVKNGQDAVKWILEACG